MIRNSKKRKKQERLRRHENVLGSSPSGFREFEGGDGVGVLGEIHLITDIYRD